MYIYIYICICILHTHIIHGTGIFTYIYRHGSYGIYIYKQPRQLNIYLTIALTLVRGGRLRLNQKLTGLTGQDSRLRNSKNTQTNPNLAL